MILKRRGVDHHLQGLHALSKRLPEIHPLSTTISKKIAMMMAGIRGETKLVNLFEKYLFLEEIYILHDLSIYSTGPGQIDCLIITPKFALILEVKNIAGEMSFLEGTGQITRQLDNGRIDYFESPMVQLNRNISLLQDWLMLRRIEFPILGAVVLPHASQKVNMQTNTAHSVLFLGEVHSFIKQLIKNQSTVHPNSAKEIAEQLNSSHQTFNPFPICSRWNVDTTCLSNGVYCTKCKDGLMIRQLRKWVCQQCHHKDTKAHRQAIVEWFMLVGGEMTNKKCREFLNIESPQLAARLLSDMNLIVEGKGKSTKYRMEKSL